MTRHRIGLAVVLGLMLPSCAAWQKAEPSVQSLFETCDTGEEVCATLSGTKVCAEPVELARLILEIQGYMAKAPVPAPEPEPKPEPAPEVPAIAPAE